MSQAQRIAKLMKEDLHKLTPWIEGELTNKFLQSGNKRVCILSNDTTLESYGFKKDHIITALKLAGFHVEYECPDRPCAMPMYVISIPLQGE